MKTVICQDDSLVYRIALPADATVDAQCVVRIPANPPDPILGDTYTLADMILIEAARHNEIPGLYLISEESREDGIELQEGLGPLELVELLE